MTMRVSCWGWENTGAGTEEDMGAEREGMGLDWKGALGGWEGRGLITGGGLTGSACNVNEL